ncbi:caspase family protein [Methylobacterium sp. NEAU 140]|uniref:caspase family protein n=1 Tax=Methylobacterium sp. NEAU 140 TaxID=3064945 RepID=UPI002734E6D8|nr:caspase family protein [Methylobacterium sp. NEAU 140]MDP4024833.1 caspase family protein [Methylobacterium sp. NEAU 140]
MLRTALALIACLALLAGAGPAAAETRVALVIGNAAYAAAPRLPNTGRDAAAVAEVLRATGFRTVTLAPDLGRAALIAALNAFSEQAERADWALVYFAGHGVEIGGTNYLVPVDARLKSDRDIGDEAVALDRVLEAIEPARKLRLVILDACRDNPFLTTMRRTLATRSVGQGLARVEPEGGTLIAFAAKHGQTALDGEGRNGPFVEALVRRVRTPGLEISKLFRLVHDDVVAATGRRQHPHVYGSLPGDDFFFLPGTAQPPPVAEAAPPPVRIAALPPAVAPTVVAPKVVAPTVVAPPAEAPLHRNNPPVNGPLVGFSRSNAGWTASVSLPEPALALSWRLGETGAFRETGLLDAVDQRTGRRVPNPAIALGADVPAGVLEVRYVDAGGATVGPFPIAFDPPAALRRDQRRMIEMAAGGWLSFRSFNGVLLYFTPLVSYRCAIRELRIGLDRAEPDRVVALPPCDEANPFAVPGTFVPYLKAPEATRAASAQIVYTDGTVSPVQHFRR